MTAVPEDRRIDRMVRSMVKARWAAVAVGAARVVTYDGWSPASEALAYTLLALLVAVNLATSVQFRLRPRFDRSVAAMSGFAVDAIVVLGMVWLFAPDPNVRIEVVLFILPAEGAMVAGFGGAVGVGLVTGIGYLARFVQLRADGVEVELAAVIMRVAVLVIVAVLVGQLSRTLANRTAHLAAVIDELERHELWRARLINVLAHDIRSPVGAAQSTFQSLAAHQGQLDQASETELLDAGLRHTQRALRLADDLLDLARSAQGRLELSTAEVELVALTQDVAAEVDGDRGRVVVSAPDGPVTARVDANRVGQVLVNLIGNALKHGAPPVTVTVEPGERGGARIAVADTGGGVGPDYVDRLFAPFTAGPGDDSTGLGLWIVRLLAEAHGGSVAYDDSAGQTTFVVRLPDVGEGDADGEAPVEGDRAPRSETAGS